jgi:WD40 repeat protein
VIQDARVSAQPQSVNHMVPMSLAEARSLRVSSLPLKKTIVTTDAYVISLTTLYDYYVASESAPSNSIGLFDKLGLRRVQAIPGHDIATTYVRSVPNVAGLARTSILSSGRDGTVKIWDERSNSASITRERSMIAPHFEISTTSLVH